jgi:hypothetical protein
VGLTGVADRSDAAVLVYRADLTGSAESPTVTTPGNGKVRLSVDTDARTMQIDATFADLIGTTTAAHIHGPTALPGEENAGVMTQTPSFFLFPADVTAGSFSQFLDMTQAVTWNPAFVTAQGGIAAAEAAFLGALADGKAYFNIHTTEFVSGEIRGFLAPVPLPAGAVLVLTGLAALGALGASRRPPA